MLNPESKKNSMKLTMAITPTRQPHNAQQIARMKCNAIRYPNVQLCSSKYLPNHLWLLALIYNLPLFKVINHSLLELLDIKIFGCAAINAFHNGVLQCLEFILVILICNCQEEVFSVELNV